MLSGDVSLARRSRSLSWETGIQNGKRALLQTSWHLSPRWTAHFRLRGIVKKPALVEKTLGVSCTKKWQFGGEIRLVDEQGEPLTGITGMAGFGLGRTERVTLYTTGLWDQSGAYRAYEILVRQSGRIATPGLLVMGDVRGLVRCEGCLQWQF